MSLSARFTCVALAVKNMLSTKQSILIHFLWLIVCAALIFSTIYLTLLWNLFSWSPSLSSLSVINLGIIILILIIVIFISIKFITTKANKLFLIPAIASSLFSLFFSYAIASQKITNSMLGRHELAPTWYICFLFTILNVPLICTLYSIKCHKQKYS